MKVEILSLVVLSAVAVSTVLAQNNQQSRRGPGRRDAELHHEIHGQPEGRKFGAV